MPSQYGLRKSATLVPRIRTGETLGSRRRAGPGRGGGGAPAQDNKQTEDSSKSPPACATSDPRARGNKVSGGWPRSPRKGPEGPDGTPPAVRLLSKAARAAGRRPGAPEAEKQLGPGIRQGAPRPQPGGRDPQPGQPANTRKPPFLQATERGRYPKHSAVTVGTRRPPLPALLPPPAPRAPPHQENPESSSLPLPPPPPPNSPPPPPQDWGLYRSRRDTRALHTCTEERPCEDTARWQLSTSQEESSHQEQALPAP
ncbi:uncharacterized protein [Equus caballus]|uniref:uncharacterized protein n=1 Tax=Equus caballus TaxID=9796 RepID=UPI0038B31AEC